MKMWIIASVLFFFAFSSAQELQSRLVDGNSSNQEISLAYRIKNNSSIPLSLEGTFVRYYMNDAVTREYLSDVLWYTLGDKSAVTIRVPGNCGVASRCFDVVFSGGVIPPGQVGEVSFRLYTLWDILDEADDPSFVASTDFVTNPKISFFSVAPPGFSSSVASSSMSGSANVSSSQSAPLHTLAYDVVVLNTINEDETFLQSGLQEMQLRGFPQGWTYNKVNLQFNASGVELDGDVVINGMRYPVHGWTVTVLIPYQAEQMIAAMYIAKSGKQTQVGVRYWVDNGNQFTVGTVVYGTQLQVVGLDQWFNLTINSQAEIRWNTLGLKQGDQIQITMQSLDGKTSDVVGRMGLWPVSFAHGTDTQSWILQELNGNDRLILNANGNRSVKIKIVKLPRAVDVEVSRVVRTLSGTNQIEATYDFSALPEFAGYPTVKLLIPAGTMLNDQAPVIKRVASLSKVTLDPKEMMLGMHFQIDGVVNAGKWLQIQLPIPAGLSPEAQKHIAYLRMSDDGKTYRVIYPDSIRDNIAFLTTDHLSGWSVIHNPVTRTVGRATDATVDGAVWVGNKTVDVAIWVGDKAKAITISIKNFVGTLESLLFDALGCFVSATFESKLSWSADLVTIPIQAVIDLVIGDNFTKNIQVSTNGTTNRVGLDHDITTTMVALLDDIAKKTPSDPTQVTSVGSIMDSSRTNAEIILADIILSKIQPNRERLYQPNALVHASASFFVPGMAPMVDAINDLNSGSINYTRNDGTVLKINLNFPYGDLARALKDVEQCKLLLCSAGTTLVLPWGIEDASQCASAIYTIYDKFSLITSKDKDQALLEGSNLLANLSMIMWLSNTDQDMFMVSVSRFADNLALWTTTIEPGYFNNNIIMKAYASLLMYHLPFGKKNMLNGGFHLADGGFAQGHGLNQMISKKFTAQGGYAEGTSYLHYLNKEVLSMFSIALQNGWITSDEIPQEYKQSGYWLMNQADPSGFIHPMDDGKAGSKFWLAPYAELTGDPQFMNYQINLFAKGGAVLDIKIKDFTPLSFLAYPWNKTPSAYEWGVGTSANVEGVSKLHSPLGSALFRSLSLLAEAGPLLTEGGSHDEQDNSSVNVTAWSPNTNPVQMVADPGYPGFENRSFTSGFDQHNVVLIDGGGVSSNRKLTEDELYTTLLAIVPALDLVIDLVKTIDAIPGIFGVGHPLSTSLINESFDYDMFQEGGGEAFYVSNYSNSEIQGHRIAQIYDTKPGTSLKWGNKAHDYRSVFQWGNDIFVMDQVYAIPQSVYTQQYLLPETYDIPSRIYFKGAYKMRADQWSSETSNTPSVFAKDFLDKDDELEVQGVPSVKFKRQSLASIASANMGSDYMRFISSFQIEVDSITTPSGRTLFPMPSGWSLSTRCASPSMCIERHEGDQLKLVFMNPKTVASQNHSVKITATAENIAAELPGEMGFLTFNVKTKGLSSAYIPAIPAYESSGAAIGTRPVVVNGRILVNDLSSVVDFVVAKTSQTGQYVITNGGIQQIIKCGTCSGTTPGYGIWMLLDD